VEDSALLIANKTLRHGRRILNWRRQRGGCGLPPFAKYAKDGAPSLFA
jgi:hypothetical protein